MGASIHQLFAPAQPDRRSPLGPAFSALLHAAAAVACLWVADVGAFEPPRPRAGSITFLVVPSRLPEIPLLRESPAASAEEPAISERRVHAPSPTMAATPPPASFERADVSEPRDVGVATLDAAAMPAPGVAAVLPPPVPPPAVSVGAFDAAAPQTRSHDPVGSVQPVRLQAARPPAPLRASAAGADRSAEFDLTAPAPRGAAAVPVREAPDEPVEIIFKPTPDYTDEARALRIQGEVVVEVEFGAAEEVRVVRVVRGLGHGLDESATRAAAHILFRPARRAGRPVDVRTVVHIVFRLA